MIIELIRHVAHHDQYRDQLNKLIDSCTSYSASPLDTAIMSELMEMPGLLSTGFKAGLFVIWVFIILPWKYQLFCLPWKIRTNCFLIISIHNQIILPESTNSMVPIQLLLQRQSWTIWGGSTLVHQDHAMLLWVGTLYWRISLLWGNRRQGATA